MKKAHWWIVVLAAALGVCGGGAGTYWWLQPADDSHAHDEHDEDDPTDRHDDHEDHGPGNGHEEHTVLEISDAELREFQIEVAQATPGEIHHEMANFPHTK